MKRHYKKILAWTGGNTPQKSEYKKLQENRYYLAALSEQVKDFVEYWGDLPNNDTFQIFKNRAIMDTFRTIESIKERVNNADNIWR